MNVDIGLSVICAGSTYYVVKNNHSYLWLIPPYAITGTWFYISRYYHD